MVKFVRLNVGGHSYHVSRTLLERYPQSLITRAVQSSEELTEPGYPGPDAEVFIDGDGIVFRFILNYLRHGRVFLPVTETRAGFMNELSHYGIVANPDDIFVVGEQLMAKHDVAMADTARHAGTSRPCSCAGPCIDSCECKKSQKPCSQVCACSRHSSGRCDPQREVAIKGPCDCLGPCRRNCGCRMAHRSCQRMCGCHGRCSHQAWSATRP